MTLLINTSMVPNGLAVWDSDGALIFKDLCPPPEKASLWLPQALQRLLTSALISRDMNVVVIDGPGGFTGLRVGFSAARVFLYVHGLQAWRLTSLEAMALCAPDNYRGSIFVSVDGQRNRIVHQSFNKTGTDKTLSNKTDSKELSAVSKPELASLHNFSPPSYSLQIGFFKDIPSENRNNESKASFEKDWVHQISSTHLLRFLKERKKESWSTLNPNYYRKSSPEEKRELERNKSN